ncbi:MAG: YceI family protein [Gammaproteobacteria bacterium]
MAREVQQDQRQITIDRAAKTGTVDVVADPVSINFGLDKMDEKARSEDFLNVAKFHTATYKGRLKFIGQTPKTVDGVTHPVKLAISNWSEYGMKLSKDGEGEMGKVYLRIQIEGPGTAKTSRT